VGKDEVATRNYIKNQEKEEHHLDQIELFPEDKPSTDKPSSDGE